MTLVVVGAGVVGLSTAYALNRGGARVTVVERLPGPGQGTSFANAGGLCPSFAGPWAAPGMVRRALRWLGQPAAPLTIRPHADPAQWRWLWRFARACTPASHAANKRTMQAIAHYSYACLQDLAAETGLSFDQGQGGILQVFRSADSHAAGQRAADILERLGVPHSLLGPDALAQIEPGLARSAMDFHGGLHFPNDGTGDAHAFCRRLAAHLAREGVTFHYDTDVTGLTTSGRRVTGLRTSQGTLEADAVVLAAGPQVRRLAPEVPVYPVKGYSLTYEGVAPGAGPRSSIMDEDSKIMITRLGDRLRVAGVAELDGFSTALRPAQLRNLAQIAQGLFPDAATGPATPWAGHRPMTPDGPPRIGPSSQTDGLWINAGHGSNGWTQAAGAGQLMADLILGRPPALDPAPFAPGR